MKKFLSLFAAMLVALAVNAATINIGPETPGGEGTNLLKAALISASAGDVIVMDAGTYFEDKSNYNGYVVFDKDITIMAAEGATPIIQPEAYIQIKNGAKVKIQNIKFDGSRQGEYRLFHASV